MQRLSIVTLISALFVVTSGCTTKKFVRTSVQTSSDALSARIDTNEGEMKEIRDNLDKKITGVDTRVSGVDSRVTALDSKTTEGLNGLKTDVSNVDQRAGQARTTAERAVNDVGALGVKFNNRNMYAAGDAKNINFKFDSAKLDKQYMDVLDQVAAALLQNPDAIVVLEGRTDNTGNK